MRRCCEPSARLWLRLTAVPRAGEEELGAGRPGRGPLLQTCRISAEVPEESHSCRLYLVILSCTALLETAEGSSKIWLRRNPPSESRWQNIPGGGEAWPGIPGPEKCALRSWLLAASFESLEAGRTLRILDAARVCVLSFTRRLLPLLAGGFSKNIQTYLELFVILPVQ